jgi:hypothetical protein
LDEAEFWVHLEFRLCREFEGIREKGTGMLWCDGIMPGHYILNEVRPRILGRAYCGASGQEEWTFELLLSRTYTSRSEIEWQELLPAINSTRWLYFDRERRFMQIEPAAAQPDGPFRTSGKQSH